MLNLSCHCKSLILLGVLMVAACRADETVSGYIDTTATWSLSSLDGEAYLNSATIAFPTEGHVVGRAPCNSFTAEQSAPYPWISIESIASTRALCPEIEAESEFFELLQSMSIVEVSGRILILTNEAGVQMTFELQP
ncbi:META domain-containing protein [Cochlodiniinecator piscidefendens]|uniref:META domain-containing protein n=1 Tax=Cochlodiniinecator piscidefendens TaxID=2715756 RepID=UPI001409C70C|nr:META domain-containing protein [Cochlodiniinecator piscidefendens]